MNTTQPVNGVIQAIREQFIAGPGSGVKCVKSPNCAKLRAAPVWLALAVTLACRPVHGQCYYTYQEIPAPPGSWEVMAGMALNNLGHVAGRYSAGGDTGGRAFFWSPETGTYLLPFPPGIHTMAGYGINDLDQVCGSMLSATRWYGFIWDRESGQYTTIEMPPWATQIYPTAISNAGTVAGTLTSSREVRAFRWENGAIHDLGADLGVVFSYANDVNEHGGIAGQGGNGTDSFGYLAQSSETTWLARPAEFSTCEAASLSNTGFIAGRGVNAPPSTQVQGLIWTPNSIHLIPPPEGFRRVALYDVNDSGRAVGYMDYPGFVRAVVWQNGRLTDLNTLVETGTRRLTTSRAINAFGQISATRGVLTPVWLSGDLTGDCHVSIEDLVLVLANFGLPHGTFPRGDVDGDGEVDISDLAILLAHWGE